MWVQQPGKLLPTGNAKDEIDVDGKKFTVSVVDAGNTVIYVMASELGLVGTETPAEINGNKAVSATIEGIRGRVCQKIGLVKDWKDRPDQNAIPAVPRLGEQAR